jgi:hypothetical protein
MSEEVVKKALNALAAIGVLKQRPCPPPQASPAQEETFPIYSWDFRGRDKEPYWRKVMAAWRQIAAHEYLPGAMQWVT